MYPLNLFGTKKNRPVTVSVFGKTDVGQSRDHNEDSFLVADLSTGNASLRPEVREHELGPRGTLLLIADGMGGAAAGEVASEMATQTIYEHMLDEWVNDSEGTPERFAYRIKEGVEKANARIHEYSQQHPELKGMGTTTTVVGVLHDQLYLSQIGDSRAYLIRNSTATQLTKDQSLMQRLVDAGELTEEEAEQSERRNIILQALGPEARVRVDLTHQTVRRGDVVVLCSDGLTGQVKKEEIAEVISREDDLVSACGKLIELANERGGPDNITVIVARFGGDGLNTPGRDEVVGHQVFPLLDEESTTEPVPVYKGSDPPSPKGATTPAVTATVAAITLAATLLAAAL